MFFVAALVPVNIRRETVLDNQARYVGFADLLGAESEVEHTKVLAAVESLERKGLLKEGRPSVRTARETLAAIAQEADRSGWWPSRAAFAKTSEISHVQYILAAQDMTKEFRKEARDRAATDASFAEQLMSCWRFLAIGGSHRAERFSDLPGLAAIQAYVELVADDPDFAEMTASMDEADSAALIRSWLECAFWHGRDVRNVLRAIGEALDEGPLSPLRGNADVVQAYATLCVWTGWREGLDRAFAVVDPFCRGCKAVLDGNFPLAYKLMDPIRKRDGLKGTLPRFLLYLVCRVAVPEKRRIAQKVLECDAQSPRVSNKYLSAAVSAGHQLKRVSLSGYWSRNLVPLPPTFCRLKTVMFTALTINKGWDEWKVPFVRQNGRQMADSARRILESGYVNACGVIFALVPELGAEETGGAILQAMEQRGTWILPYQRVQPLWEHFVADLARQTSDLCDDDEEVDKAEAATSHKITWELKCLKSENDGLLAVRRIAACRWEKRFDGERTREYVGCEDLLSDEYRSHLKDCDTRLAAMLLSRDLTGEWYYDSKSGVSDALALLCDMDNVEIVFASRRDPRLEQPETRRSVRIKERPCDMKYSVANDGSVTIEMPEWQAIGDGYKRCGYVLRETDCADELAFTVVDPVVGETAKLLGLYGTNGVMRIPREGVEQKMWVFDRLSRVASPVVADEKGEDEIPEVKADSTCFLRLEFEDGCLAIHAFTRPSAKNGNLAFEPGFGAKSCVISGEDGAYRLVRDLEAEKAALRPVEKAMADSGAWFDRRCSWMVDSLAEAVAVVESLKKLSPAIEIEWRKGRTLKVSRPKFKLESTGRKNNWFGIRGKVMLEDGRGMDVLRFLEAMRTGSDGSGYVKIADGDYVALTKEMQRQFAALVSAGRENDGAYEIPRGAIPMLQAVFGGDGVALPAAMAKAADAVRRALETEPEPPKTLQAQLRPYQLEGYRWLSRLASCGFGACLADDMGLGKTVQIITLLLERAKDGPSLVVAPASVCGNWRNEIRRFAPTLEPIMAIEDAKGVAKAGPRSVVLASYGYLLFHEKEFAGKQWNGLVLDEAQAIKNEEAKRTKAVKSFKARFRVAATGTPVENRLLELWSIFDFLNTGLLGTADDFETMGRDAIKRLVKPLILRRLKGDVLDDLPPKTEVTRFVELGEKERSGYEACRLKALEDVASAEKKRKLAMLLTGLTRLRRYCCNPSLVAGGSRLASAKLDALAELMEELRDGGHRALVFSQFTDYLEIVKKMVEGKGWSLQYLDGSTPLKERGRRVDAFQNGEGDFFLISLKAGGTGLNLTAADYVIILDPWWNPAVENQAADRAHRIGQTRPVTIYRLIAKDTVEEKVLALHNEKRILAEDMLSDTGASSVNSEVLMGLLRGKG
ncbi:MAG: DEAD/DEAH box helicase [Kiritimatiellae bacterium]|nr:DEAD/DEAH box helicase [Kiritimatiellia bacterium]